MTVTTNAGITNMRILVYPAAILFSLSLYSQKPPRKDIVSFDTMFPSKSLPVSKWVLTLNPYGILEPPAALGFGIGYYVNKKIELWAETSFLTNGFMKTDGPLTGIRQILQIKYFLDNNRNFFFAAEVRFKGFQYRDRDNFINADTHDTLMDYSNFSRHWFVGGGLQLGWRTNLSRNGRFQLELTAGLGLRTGRDIHYDAPAGYKFLPIHKIDVPPLGLGTEGNPVYLPGSMRVLYTFGKHIRT